MNKLELIGIIKSSLKTNKKIDMKSNSNNVDAWDSLGKLSILITLDKKFKKKVSKLPKLATAESVKEIYSVLKKAKLVK